MHLADIKYFPSILCPKYDDQLRNI